MKYEARRNLVRALVGAVLASSRSEREVRLVIDALESEPFFASDVAEALRGVLMALGGPSSRLKSEFSEDSRNPTLDVVYAQVQRSRTSKKELLTKMRNADSSFPFSESDLQRQSVKGMIAAFFEHASDSAVARFLQASGVEPIGDPYLRGIGRAR